MNCADQRLRIRQLLLKSTLLEHLQLSLHFLKLVSSFMRLIVVSIGKTIIQVMLNSNLLVHLDLANRYDISYQTYNR